MTMLFRPIVITGIRVSPKRGLARLSRAGRVHDGPSQVGFPPLPGRHGHVALDVGRTRIDVHLAQLAGEGHPLKGADGDVNVNALRVGHCAAARSSSAACPWMIESARRAISGSGYRWPSMWR